MRAEFRTIVSQLPTHGPCTPKAHSLFHGAASYAARLAAASNLNISSFRDISRMSLLRENDFRAVLEELDAAMTGVWLSDPCGSAISQILVSIPLTLSMPTPSRMSLLHLYGSLLRTSRSFSSYNFRTYFIRRTRRIWREFQVTICFSATYVGLIRFLDGGERFFETHSSVL